MTNPNMPSIRAVNCRDKLSKGVHGRRASRRLYFASILFSTALAWQLSVGLSRGDDAPAFALRDGDKVVFYGDSITEQRLFTVFAETFVQTRYPDLKITYTNSGWGGDRVTGGAGGPIDLRLNRDVLPFQPTVVTIMLGMNDGEFSPANAQITETYEKGYEHILDSLQTKLPGVRITLIQPSPHDDFTRPPQFAGGFNSVLQNFSQFVKDQAIKNNQMTADLNTPMVEMLTKANGKDPTLARQIIPDGVHPGPAGHLVMAEALLKAWGATSLVSDIEIDAAAGKLVRAADSHLEDVKTGDVVTWTETDQSLPMPTRSIGTDDASRKLIDLVLGCSDFIETLDKELLKVTGLKAPVYQLKIDDQTTGVFSRDDLAKGINLATLPTPMMDQASSVYALTVAHSWMHFQRWRTFQVPLESMNAPAVNQALPPLLAALDGEEAKVVDQLRAKAQPVVHHYQLIPQQTPP